MCVGGVLVVAGREGGMHTLEEEEEEEAEH